MHYRVADDSIFSSMMSTGVSRWLSRIFFVVVIVFVVILLLCAVDQALQLLVKNYLVLAMLTY